MNFKFKVKPELCITVALLLRNGALSFIVIIMMLSNKDHTNLCLNQILSFLKLAIRGVLNLSVKVLIYL